MFRSIIPSIKFTVLLGVLVFLTDPGKAQLSTTFAGLGTPVASYVGPGDIVSGATVFYSLRAYTAAIAAAGTQKLVNLQRSSDSHTCDVLVATSGGMGLTANCSTGGDNGQTSIAFCNATTCTFQTWYDQGGNAFDATPSLGAPTFNATGLNNLPAAILNGSLSLLNHGNVGASTTASVSVVAKRTGSFTSFSAMAVTQPWGVYFSNSADSVSFFGDGIVILAVAGNDNVAHSINGVGNGASSFLNVDGTNTTGNPAPGATGVNIGVGAFFNGSSNPLTGAISEVAYYDNHAFTPTESASLQANKKAYWGTP